MSRFKCQFAAALAVASVIACHCLALGPSYPPQTTLEQVNERIAQCPTSHPRLFTTNDELSHLATSIGRDPLRKQLADLIIYQATLLQNEKPIERNLIGRRLLSVSGRCVQRVLTLAMAYHLTHDASHLERCRKEMLAAARFTDWHPEHFLDVAEMTFGVAI